MALHLRSALAIACAVAGFTALALPAQAQTPLIWNGAGVSGVDPYGHGWQYNANGWGIPGVGAGVRPWVGPDSLFSFSITFDALPQGVSIDTSVNADTRLVNVTTGTLWAATLDAPNTVTFTAPVGGELVPDNLFFANVAFTGGDPANSPFTANYNNAVAVVPEANTFALVLPALGMIGAVVIAKRRKK